MGTLELSVAMGFFLKSKIKYCFGVLKLFVRLVVAGPAYIKCSYLASSASLEEHLIEAQLISLHGNVFKPQAHQPNVLPVIVVVLVNCKAAFKRFAKLAVWVAMSMVFIPTYVIVPVI